MTENQYDTMNSTEALAFSRMRYNEPSGDYGRQIRQQLVIAAVLNKLKANPQSALSNEFLDAVSDNVRSNISLTSMRNLATKYRDAGSTINRDQMTGAGVMIDGVSYQEMSQDEITRVHNEIVNAKK